MTTDDQVPGAAGGSVRPGLPAWTPINLALAVGAGLLIVVSFLPWYGLRLDEGGLGAENAAQSGANPWVCSSAWSLAVLTSVAGAAIVLFGPGRLRYWPRVAAILAGVSLLMTVLQWVLMLVSAPPMTAAVEHYYKYMDAKTVDQVVAVQRDRLGLRTMTDRSGEAQDFLSSHVAIAGYLGTLLLLAIAILILLRVRGAKTPPPGGAATS